MSKYNKTVTAIVGAAIAFATLTITSEPVEITASEWLSGAIGLATGLGVYGVANRSSQPVGSCVMAARNLDGWWHYALCADPEIEFYSEPKSKEEATKSKSVCRVCPVRLECLAHAFYTSCDYGIFGGVDFSTSQRTTMAALFMLPISSGEVAVLSVLVSRMSD